MVKATFEIPDYEDRVLKIVKGKNGFTTKQQAILLVIQSYGDEMLEPELKPEFIKEMKRIEKEKGIPFKDINDLRKQIEG